MADQGAQGTVEERVEQAVKAMDAPRLELQGGYPSEWALSGGNVFVATLDDNGGPVLLAMSADEFLADYGVVHK